MLYLLRFADGEFKKSPVSVNISCLKCPSLTGACLVTCKPYINFLYSRCIFLVFCILHFVLYFFYLRTSVALIKLSLSLSLSLSMPGKHNKED